MFSASEHLWMDWDTKAEQFSDFFWKLKCFLDLAARETSWRDPSSYIKMLGWVLFFLQTGYAVLSCPANPVPQPEKDLTASACNTESFPCGFAFSRPHIAYILVVDWFQLQARSWPCSHILLTFYHFIPDVS